MNFDKTPGVKKTNLVIIQFSLFLLSGVNELAQQLHEKFIIAILRCLQYFYKTIRKEF
jgi:hypothetical protein